MLLNLNKKAAVISQASLGTIFPKSKKGLSPVVTTTLLLVVVVAAVLGFQTWFQTYQSGINSDVEIKFKNSDDLKILDLIGNTLYVQNNNLINKTINSVKIGNIDCNFSNQNISTGVTQINITSCLENQTTSIADIVVFSNDKIIEKKEYIKKIITNMNINNILSCVNLSNNLVGLWHMDENSGLINDFSNSNNDGTTNGGITYGVSGKIGNALLFDGINGYIDFGSNTNISFERTNLFTFSTWIKLNSIGTYSEILGKRVKTGNVNGYSFYITPSGTVTFKLGNHWNLNALEMNTINTLTTNNWHHVVVTYSGNSAPSGVKIYIDNVSQSLTTVKNSLSGSILAAVNLQLGSSDTSEFFNGTIDEVAIWNTDLNSIEISNLYNNNSVGINICSP